MRFRRSKCKLGEAKGKQKRQKDGFASQANLIIIYRRLFAQYISSSGRSAQTELNESMLFELLFLAGKHFANVNNEPQVILLLPFSQMFSARRFAFAFYHLLNRTGGNRSPSGGLSDAEGEEQ